jgi:PadR family transcriptional regulator, regulatory protein PadR
VVLKANVEGTLKLWNKEYKKGFFAYIILLMLKKRVMYGFEINNELLEITKGEVSFQESGIYHILKKLNKKGFVTTQWQKSDKGPKRKYYKITESGNQLLEIFTEKYIFPINKAVDKMIIENFPTWKKH